MSEITSPRGPHTTKVLNRLVQGTSRIYFGILPVVLHEDDTLNNNCLESTIRGFNWTGRIANFSISRFQNYVNIVPNADVNDYTNNPVTVEFVCDDTLDNYCLLHKWVNVYRTLEDRKEYNNPPGKPAVWDAQRAYCSHMDIIVANNTREVVSILRFKHVFCDSVGDITMNFNSAEEVSFTSSFKYNDWEIIRNPHDVEEALQQYS